jgi:hypothetical protein
MFSIFHSRSNRTSSFLARVQRAQEEGYVRGADEAKIFMLAAGKDFQQRQALDWIDEAIEDGREDLQAQRFTEREIEAWDMSCRIMFMLTITRG